MFFVGKLVWAVLQPGNLLVLCLLAGSFLLLAFRGRRGRQGTGWPIRPGIYAARRVADRPGDAAGTGGAVSAPRNAAGKDRWDCRARRRGRPRDFALLRRNRVQRLSGTRAWWHRSGAPASRGETGARRR